MSNSQLNGTIQKTTPKEETILFVLYNQEVYGRQIQQAVQEVSGGRRRISEGVLYSSLQKLEENGFVISRWGEDSPDNPKDSCRRYYKLTEAGITQVKQVQKFHARLLTWQPS